MRTTVHTRREFLGGVGRGVLFASLGPVVASELGVAFAFEGEDGDRLTFGDLEPLVALLQETEPERLMPILVKKIGQGLELERLVAAGALANARNFGGVDYDGYHIAMALMPSLQMAQALPTERRALPVLKVLYRNASRIQRRGGKEVMRPVAAAKDASAQGLREAELRADMETAEGQFAAIAAGGTPEQAYDALQDLVRDNIDVHQVVLSWRAWDLLRLTGMEHAHTMLRQSVRHCVDRERGRQDRGRPEPSIRKLLPQLIEDQNLVHGSATKKKPTDADIESWGRTVFGAGRDDAAAFVASLLGEGYPQEQVGESLSLAGNQLLLNDPGRKNAEPGKPKGSVHGASVGVHASDSALAWRRIASVCTDPRDAVASLIVGAYHTAGQSGRVRKEPIPYEAKSAELKKLDGPALVKAARRAVEAGDQVGACAAAHRYYDVDPTAKPLFDALLEYAISEDGALHAEKYFATATEEFAATTSTRRRRYLVSLARVTASEYGFPAPGHKQVLELLRI